MRGAGDTPPKGDIMSSAPLPGVIGCPPGVPGTYAELGVIGGWPPGVDGKYGLEALAAQNKDNGIIFSI